MNGHAMTKQPVAVCSANNSRKGLYNREVAWLTQWVLVPLLSVLSLSLADIAGSKAEQGEIVSGVLESVSLESSSVRLRNPIGQPIILKIRKPHLLEHVTLGDRVTVIVNKDHEIIKLIETPIPELPPPTSQ
jgi:hypothetical protein